MNSKRGVVSSPRFLCFATSESRSGERIEKWMGWLEVRKWREDTKGEQNLTTKNYFCLTWIILLFCVTSCVIFDLDPDFNNKLLSFTSGDVTTNHQSVWKRGVRIVWRSHHPLEIRLFWHLTLKILILIIVFILSSPLSRNPKWWKVRL